MAKEDVKQAISETIVSNGKRAITAESLSNVLNMIVDEGGSGGGVLVVRLGTIVGEETLVQSSEEKEHNKKVFETIKTAYYNKSISMPIVALDHAELLKLMEPEIGLYLEDFSMIVTAPCTGYINSAALQTEIGYKEFVFVINTDSSVANPFMLLPDGTLIIDSI